MTDLSADGNGLESTGNVVGQFNGDLRALTRETAPLALGKYLYMAEIMIFPYPLQARVERDE